jgi:hypothetical protein
MTTLRKHEKVLLLSKLHTYSVSETFSELFDWPKIHQHLLKHQVVLADRAPQKRKIPQFATLPSHYSFHLHNDNPLSASEDALPYGIEQSNTYNGPWLTMEKVLILLNKCTLLHNIE